MITVEAIDEEKCFIVSCNDEIIHISKSDETINGRDKIILCLCN